jgi:hypothetical protein
VINLDELHAKLRAKYPNPPGCDDIEDMTWEQARKVLVDHENHQLSRCSLLIQARMFTVHEELKRRQQS